MNISDFLGRYKKMVPLEQEVRDVVVEWARERGIEIEREKISLQKEKVFLNTLPTIKTKLFLHKKELLVTLRKHLGKRSPKEIV